MNQSDFQFIFRVLCYIADAPYFWESITSTVLTAMFIGATLYDGNLGMTAKGTLTIVSYAFFLFIIFSTRVFDVGNRIGYTNQVMAYAGMTTVIVLTVAYLFGMYSGVFIVKVARKGKHHAI